MGAVVVLSVLSANGAHVFSNADKQARTALAQHSGGQILTADELVKLIRHEKLVAYWLGTISGSKYTLAATANGPVTITYLSS